MIKRILATIYILIVIISSHSIFAADGSSLFNDAQYRDVKLSPDAKYISMVIIVNKNKRAILVIDRKTRKQVGFIAFPGNNDVGDYVWANNKRLVIKVLQGSVSLTAYQSYGELFAVNYNGKNQALIYGYRTGEKQTGTRLSRKKQNFGWADIIGTLPHDKRHILITSTPMDKKQARLGTIQELDIYRGTQKKKGRVPAPNARIIVDENGEFKLAVGLNHKDQKMVYFRKNDNWQPVASDKFGVDFDPLTVTESDNGFYALDNYHQNFLGLFKYNFIDGSYKKIFVDKKVDVTSASITADGKHIYALRVDDGYPEYLLINKKLPQTQAFKKMLATFVGYAVNLTSQSIDGRYYIVKVSSDINPGQYYFFDTQENKLENLFSSTKLISKKKLAVTEPFSFKSSDGIILNGYLTKANAIKNKIAPLVVLVHGGPRSRDYWQYNAQVQYLALNGYSVLQLNFRGSYGYGRKFMNAGNFHWADTIQRDLKEAAEWAISHKLANADKICIMGGSFGAYSAVESALVYPDFYQCAVANAGIYDLSLLYTEGDITKRNFGDSFIRSMIGTDEDKLKAMSPVSQVNKLKIPLFLAHGKKDERAPLAHVIELKEQLDKYHKKYQWFVVDKEGHGFWNNETQKKYMAKVKNFLDKSLM